MQERADNMSPLSFWEWLKHLLLRAAWEVSVASQVLFFALNTALRNKALRARNLFCEAADWS